MHKVLKSSRFEIISARQTDHGVSPEVKCRSAALCSVWLTPSGRRPLFKSDSQPPTCSPLLSEGWKNSPSKQKFPQPLNLSWLRILWLCKHMGGSEVYTNKHSAAEMFCLLQMFECPLIKYITGSQWMIETFPTIAPAISLSPRCGRAFSS